MIGWICFLISFILVFASSYLILSLFKEKNVHLNIIYLFLIIFSQVVLSFEILSLIKQIHPLVILFVNLVSFVLAKTIFKLKKAQLPQININKESFNNIFKALKKDKILAILAVALVFSCVVSLTLAILAPNNGGDALIYHIARAAFWAQNFSLNHYETVEIRQLIFPINSEILMLWSLAFLKRDFLLQPMSFLFYTGTLYVLFCFLSCLKISTPRKLWTVFILAAIPSLILEASSVQTNTLVGLLILISLFLFLYGIQKNKKTPIVFSSISYALSVGVKLTSIIYFPIFAALLILILLKEKQKFLGKSTFVFGLGFVIAFALLSSYNYILNYIDFGNFIYSPNFVDTDYKMSFGIKPLIANIIRYFYVLMDFSGIHISSSLSNFLIGIKSSLFNVLNLNAPSCAATVDVQKINTLVQEDHSTWGLLGLLFIIPLCLVGGIKGIKHKNKRTVYLSACGLSVIAYIVIISGLSKFWEFMNRYLTTVIIVGAPIFAFSYTRKKSFLKILIASILLFNFIFITVNNESKPLLEVLKTYKDNPTYFMARFVIRSHHPTDRKAFSSDAPLFAAISNKIDNFAKVGVIASSDLGIYSMFEVNPSWKIYPIRMELMKKRNNYKYYDYLLVEESIQQSSVYDTKHMVFNYKTDQNGKVIYYRNKKNENIYFYSNSTNVAQTSGYPYYMVSRTDINKIPACFKLIYTMPTKINSNKHMYLYKNLCKR